MKYEHWDNNSIKIEQLILKYYGTPQLNHQYYTSDPRKNYIDNLCLKNWQKNGFFRQKPPLPLPPPVIWEENCYRCDIDD